MKKTLAISLIFLFSFSFIKPQGGYKKESKVLNAGIGFGLNGIYGSSDLPPLSVGFQYGVHEKISAGGLIGYSASSYGYLGYNWSYSYIFIGGRGEYHFDKSQLKILNDNLDLYGGLTLGFNIVTVSEPNLVITGYSAQGSYFLFGFHIGSKYYFSQNIGAFIELGYGVGYFTIGASFKL